MRRTRWHLVLLAATAWAAGTGGVARAQWEIFNNFCTAKETDTPGSPIQCMHDERTLVAAATNSGDRLSYSTQQFIPDLTQACVADDPAHPWYDDIFGGCKVEVVWLEPNTGINSSLWVAFGHSLEHGEFNGMSGLLVLARTVSCDCYGHRPES